jgi:hypothetical protein
MPLLATGRLGADYNLIKIYYETALEKGVSPEKIILNSDDLNYLKIFVENSSSRDLWTIIDVLSKRFIDRIDPVIAKETIEKYLNTKVDPEVAANMIARVVAMWCIEAGEVLGYIRLRDYLR